MGIKVQKKMIIENADAKCCLREIQKTGYEFQHTVESLTSNMNNAQKMTDFIKSNSPIMLEKLWPKIKTYSVMPSLI